MSYTTELSVLVEAAVFALPAGSETAPTGMLAITVPSVMPDTATFQVVGPPLSVTVFVPPAVPVITTSPAVNVAGSIASLNTTVKLIGEVFVGSDCPDTWLTVAVGGVVSFTLIVSAFS